MSDRYYVVKTSDKRDEPEARPMRRPQADVACAPILVNDGREIIDGHSIVRRKELPAAYRRLSGAEVARVYYDEKRKGSFVAVAKKAPKPKRAKKAGKAVASTAKKPTKRATKGTNSRKAATKGKKRG